MTEITILPFFRKLEFSRVLHEIDEYVDETVRTHIGSLHIRVSSPSSGSHQSNELTNGLHDNLGQMHLGSNSVAPPHTRLPTTGDLQFNLGDWFQPANVNLSLDYQPPRHNYPPNQVREDVSPQRYQPRVNGNWDRDKDREIRQPQRDITKKSTLLLLNLMVEWILILSLIG